MEPAVSLRGLTKRFGEKVAVAAIDLDVPAGSFFGLVGPNGAGKSTTLKMATGLLRPDAGGAWIDGTDVWADPIGTKSRIGVLPEDLRLFERLTGAELLAYNGLLRGMDPDTVAVRSEELLLVLGLTEARDKLVVDYSHGMRKKVALACALVHAPRVLFLDEPFEAIDPVSVRSIQDVLRRHTAGGGTIVFSSHVMDVVERLCDMVAVVNEGSIVAVGPTSTIRAGRRLEDAFVDLVGASVSADGRLTWLGPDELRHDLRPPVAGEHGS
ncbi:MAG: ABC transporter ATP-binding protein [Acidimicrobiia bacterium]|nr:ABC transporter ATP-binding protein [Acidimicrobiia bacterium]